MWPFHTKALNIKVATPQQRLSHGIRSVSGWTSPTVVLITTALRRNSSHTLNNESKQLHHLDGPCLCLLFRFWLPSGIRSGVECFLCRFSFSVLSFCRARRVASVGASPHWEGTIIEPRWEITAKNPQNWACAHTCCLWFGVMSWLTQSNCGIVF